MPVSVLIADDSLTYRTGIARAVAAHDGLDLVSEVDDGDAAFEAISRLDPDVAILDFHMPGLDGVQVCAQVRATVPASRTRMVLLTAQLDDELRATAAAAGIDLALSKEEPRREICAAVARLGRALG